MGLFSSSLQEKMKKLYPVEKDFATIISNILNVEFHETFIDGMYAFSSGDGKIILTNAEIILFSSENQTEIKMEDMGTREDMLGFGKSWFSMHLVKNVVSVLEAYEMGYKIYINPVEAYPLLITTSKGNIAIMPESENSRFF